MPRAAMARVRALSSSGRAAGSARPRTSASPACPGKVVVLHFWTASCINCIRVLEELRPIEQRFAAEAVVVGIHSPKFPHEHEHLAVERAVERLGIRHPVLDDPDLTTWQQYGVKGWPTLVVVDPEGYVVGGIAGEGSGAVVLAAVEQAITEHDAKNSITRGAVAGFWGSVPLGAGVRTISWPAHVATDATGRRLAITDTGNDRVVVADLQGRVEQIYPLLTRPQGVAFDGTRLLVCDTGTDRVLAIDRRSGMQSVLAANLASPTGVAVLADGSVLISEAGRHRLWRLPPGGGDPILTAGTGQPGLQDGQAGEGGGVVLGQPAGVAALPDGGAVFVDADASALRVLTPTGEIVTLVGQGLFDWGASDGGPDSSALQHPVGVAVGPAGAEGLPVIYVADTYNQKLRAWSGTDWSAGAGTIRTLPAIGLEEPRGVAVLPDGRLVVADTNHHRLVLVDPGAAEVVELVVDETWLGTAVGDAMHTDVGGRLSVPFELDLGRYSLDTTAGPPVRVEVSADPPTLLGAGPRRWALDGVEGHVEVPSGSAGEGMLVVELEVAVCDDEASTVLRARSRHDLTVGDRAGPTQSRRPRQSADPPPPQPDGGAPTGRRRAGRTDEARPAAGGGRGRIGGRPCAGAQHRPVGSAAGRRRGRGPTMRIGIMVGEVLGAVTLDELIGQVRTAADHGFGTAWSAQLFGWDALTTLAIAGREVPDIRLGTAVVPTYPSIPWLWPAKPSRSRPRPATA